MTRPTIKSATVTDKSQKLKRDLARIAKSQVLVGIPESDGSARQGPAFQIGQLTFHQTPTINNAALLYLHTHGSPIKGIPPRPVLEPSIKENADLISEQLGAAAQAVLAEKPAEAEKRLNLAGIVAANGAKRYILEGDKLAPNAPATIAAKGSDRPLVASSQMVRAITSVVVHSLEE